MNHYVYLLESRVEQKYYIGCRSCKTEIGKDKYMGSSSVMTEYDKDNCNKIILKRFNSREEAIAYEIEMHNKFDVSVNPLFWNKTKQTSTNFDTTGTTLSESHKAEIRKRFKEIERTELWKANISKGRTGYVMPNETKEKLSKQRKGKPLSDKHKLAISKGSAGKVLSDEHKKNIGKSNSGKKRTKEQCAKFSEIRKGKPPAYSATRYENIECPHCGKIGMKANMKRYHFNNCKEVLCP